ncbi:DNA polymerase I [Gorillibacterium timonense]|uniref:DNA polymerase I n=1 Tax=Gorillibacterium timonense TaxID=1689269 RepID=UPI00071D9980|nr:DNA polymerase I [Gorillibacterium timonense]
MSKLVLIDGNSIASRAFYALPLLSNSSGLHTNAAYGFTTMLLRLIEEEKPTHFLVAFDAGKITFRHSGYQEYKGGRAKTPPELSEQYPLIKELVRAFGIAQFELEGYEADDIIGTMSRVGEEAGMEVVIVSGDKDMLQLASDRVTIALTRKGISETERFDPAHIKEVYDLVPDQIRDLKGLMGDTSDNIPGIPGVGEKTALKLLHEHPTVEEVLEAADGIKGKLGEKVRAHADDARMSKELATIFREVPMDVAWEDKQYAGYDGPSLGGLFRKLEFKSLLEKMDFSGGTHPVGADAGGPAENGEGETSSSATAQDQDIMETILLTSDTLGALIEQLPHVQAVHIETIGDNPHVADLAGLGFLAGESGYFMTEDLLALPEAASIREWLSDPAIPKTVCDVHRAKVALAWRGIPLNGCDFDVVLAAYLLDPTESTLTLHAMVNKYGLPGIADDTEVYGKGAKFKLPEAEILSSHLKRKAAAIAKIAAVQKKELDEKEMSGLFFDLELPLAGVLADMELQGMKIAPEVLNAIGDELKQRIEALVADIYRHAGTEFNLNSPKQLGEILFNKLGLPVIKKTKTGPSTDVEVLERLRSRHEVVAHILDYRTLAKLQSTYIEGLLKEVRPETGKIHTFYRQTITATGRLSSQYPNLQNIPIRLEEGRKIRKAFVPSEPGWKIISADYSQIELRVLAHISKDERLIDAFHHNMDIHTKTAMDVFGVTEDQVDRNMRRSAKAVNFGIVYGISDYGLSQNLDISRAEAAKFIEQYFAIFQGVRKYMDDIVQTARRDGYVTTLLNRRRYLPEINASNYNLRSFAERTAMNTPIQGTAADIIKLAMVQMAKRLQDEKLNSRMLLQVHDELVFEVPEEEVERMKQLVPEVMEGALALDVPLKVEVEYGADWYEAK